jgi:hypothetical protein
MALAIVFALAYTESCSKTILCFKTQMRDIEIAQKLVNKKNNAFTRGIHFELSFKRMKQLCAQKRCFYTNTPFVGIAPSKTGKPPGPVHPHAMTIDRVDNDLGYIDSNVVACTYEFNSLKRDMPIGMIKKMFKGILKMEQRNSIKKKSKVKMVILKTQKSA